MISNLGGGGGGGGVTYSVIVHACSQFTSGVNLMP